MVLRVLDVPVASQPWRTKRLLEIACDLPGCEVTRIVPYRSRRSIDKLDFCGPDHRHAARRRGGPLDRKLRSKSLERWGVESPNSLDEAKRMSARTKRQRWADENYNNRAQAAKTCQERMGCENPAQSDPVKEKIRQSMLERWGVEVPSQSPAIRQKIESTMLDRWGVPHAWCIPEHRERNKSKEVRDKIHRTMKARGRYGKSQIEDRLYRDLCELYGPDRVERQAMLNGWCIDFKVKDVYVQLDGVYWHGLDRPLEELRASQNARDKVILGTRSRDSEQNEWCQKMGIRLVRVTDSEYSSHGVASIVDEIER